MKHRSLVVVDSITQAVGGAAGMVVVCGSHGGVSSGRFALEASPYAVVFNDAGGGRDAAGIAALALLQRAGIAACTVAHTSARIGDARSTLQDGTLTHCNARASALRARAGMACSEWVDLLTTPDAAGS
jgi:hypothetical protein